MKRILVIVTMIGTCLSNANSANMFPVEPAVSAKGTVTGTIYDDNSHKPIEYATIALYSSMQNELITGTVSDANGRFQIGKLDQGSYYLSIKFIGYNEEVIRDIVIKERSSKMDIGEILLKVDSKALDEVIVTSNKPRIDYQIDKKVIQRY